LSSDFALPKTSKCCHTDNSPNDTLTHFGCVGAILGRDGHWRSTGEKLNNCSQKLLFRVIFSVIEMLSIVNVTAATAPNGSQRPYTKLDWAIVVSCLLFIFALAVSAYFESAIRVLHTFQAFIYLAVIAGALRHQKWAYGAGISIAAFWNYINLFVNSFIRNGVETLGAIMSGGHVANSGTMIAIPAALGHFGMIAFCLWAYLRLRSKRLTDISILLGSGAIAIGYFAAIIAIFGPQYLPLFRKVFRL
jgi:uncharacterized membrane protein